MYFFLKGKSQFREGNIQFFEQIKLTCPNCYKTGFIQTFIGFFIRRLIRYVGNKSERIIELKSVNGICGACKQGFRITNGYTIRRKKRKVEIISFNLQVIAFSLSFVSYGLATLLIMFEQLNSSSIQIVYLTTILALVIFILDYFSPLVHLHILPELDGYYPLASFPTKEQFDEANRLTIMKNKTNVLIFELQTSEPISQININKENGGFLYEKNLQNYLGRNISSIRFNNKRLGLPLNGIEYHTGIGNIDILAIDEDSNYIVIELKRARTADKTLGQISRYIGWVTKHLAENDPSRVFGIIIASKIDKKLKYASSNSSNITVIEYKIENGIDLMFKNVEL